MKAQGKKKLITSFGLSIAVILATLLLHGTGILDRWENKARDMAALFFAAPSDKTDNIKLVLLDQNSLDWVHQTLGLSWPWPRELHGAVLSSISRHGAAAIGVDVLFTEPSAFGVDDDRKLGQAMDKSQKIVLGSIATGNASGSHLKWPEGLHKNQFSIEQPLSSFAFPTFTHAVMPTKDLGNSAKVLCNVRQEPDLDGINRRVIPVSYFDETVLPALPLGVFLFLRGQDRLTVKADALKIGQETFPLDPNGRLIPRFRGKTGKVYEAISCAALIQDALLHAQGEKVPDTIPDLTGAYVFYGFSAAGLMDLHPTPVGSKTPGVEFHATVLDNFLARDFLYPISFGAQLPFLFILLFFTVFLLRHLPFGALSSLVLALAFLAPAALFSAVYKAGGLINVLDLQFALGSGAFLAILVNFYFEGKQRRFIKHSFNHYLSPSVIETLITHPENLQLGGERKELTIFFSDLQGFTSISESLEPEALARLLNDYLGLMTDIIMDEGGTVDKYEGDAIIAFWNAPISFEDHALRGVRAAIRCQQVLAKHRPIFKEQTGHDLLMRIGMNTGPAVVGNFGSSRRFDYTMLGDAVNLAARLEGMNKMFDTYTMISEAAWKKVCDDIPARAIADILVIGKNKPVRVYEPLTRDQFEQSRDRLALFEQGRAAFAATNVQKALTFFEQLPHDPPALKYMAACRQILETGSCSYIKDGLWAQTSK